MAVVGKGKVVGFSTAYVFQKGEVRPARVHYTVDLSGKGYPSEPSDPASFGSKRMKRQDAIFLLRDGLTQAEVLGVLEELKSHIEQYGLRLTGGVYLMGGYEEFLWEDNGDCLERALD